MQDFPVVDAPPLNEDLGVFNDLVQGGDELRRRV